MSVLCQKVGVRIWTVGLLATALISGMIIYFGASPTQAATKPPDSADLLKFTAGGHVLGFQPGSFVAACSDHALKVEFIGARPVLPQATNASLKASKDVQPLDTVTYADLWEGVTLVYDGGDGILESTYHIAPQKSKSDGSPSVRPADRIRLRYNVPVALDGNGNLLLKFKTGQMQESAPVAWQQISGKRIPVKAAFRILDEKEVGFSVGDYDPQLPLIIDPELIWNTFMGGGGFDRGRAITVDTAGNIYVTGYSENTWGSPINAHAGGNDAFAAKLDSKGNRIWNTFMGSEGSDDGLSIAVDADGNIYVAGWSDATWGSPINIDDDHGCGFVAKLDRDGNRLWNTFMGTYDRFPDPDYGRYNDRWTSANAIAVDADGNVYVVGNSFATWGSPVNPYTENQRYPGLYGFSDVFVIKLDSNGNRIWNTFMGGESNDTGSDIALDVVGNVYVAGDSISGWGSPINDHRYNQDGFAAKLDSNGNRIWNTFMGTIRWDFGRGIALDAVGSVYVLGESDTTWGSPINAHASPDWTRLNSEDVFVLKLDSSGKRLWNTFMGSKKTDEGGNEGIAVDVYGNVYVTGHSWANWGSPVNPHPDNEDERYGSRIPFVAKLDNGGSRLDSGGNLLWNTFMGSGGFGSGGIAVDDYGYYVYVTGGSYKKAFVAKLYGTKPEFPWIMFYPAFTGKKDEHIGSGDGSSGGSGASDDT